ncbi:ABC transporter substrate-binding protein, partial [Caldivirga sp. UBA161]|uniref:ABC transporter substrate-binding protein n=1 Tax=Caldivirga sp. UBA161 TaxID=1915569 RepID=UPI0025C07A9B
MLSKSCGSMGVKVIYGSLMTVLVLLLVLTIKAAYAQQTQITAAVPTTIVYAPGVPVWNPYDPDNLMSRAETWTALAAYNTLNGKWWPLLADNWSIQVLPNGSGILTIYLRKGLYWFNGSAVMPFTAWDVYAYFYIGVKAFGWYYPYINNSYADEDIRVINNYTIQFLFQRWSPTEYMYLLMSAPETPYPVWKWAIEALKTMNTTQARIYGNNNITKYVAPYWGLSPWYVSAITPNYIVLSLEPESLLNSWEEMFPINSFNYFNPITYWFVGGAATTDVAALESGKAQWAWIGMPWAMLESVNKSGVSFVLVPSFTGHGLVLNPRVYPFNNPYVRQAFCYAMNRTEMIIAEGAGPLGIPNYMSVPIPPYALYTYPASVQEVAQPCSFNLTKAIQLFEKGGLIVKNGQVYLPNGSSLKLLVIVPYQGEANAIEATAKDLAAIGITVNVYIDAAWASDWPNGYFEAASFQVYNPSDMAYGSSWRYFDAWWAFIGGYASATPLIAPYHNVSSVWPFAWPNGTCTPVTAPVAPPLNSTIVWCVNSTYGYINLTNWQNWYGLLSPGTSGYDYSLEVFLAWWRFFEPSIPYDDGYSPLEYNPKVIDAGWLMLQCIPLTIRLDASESLFGMWAVTNPQLLPGLSIGAYAPPGVVPPLAEAIANGS